MLQSRMKVSSEKKAEVEKKSSRNSNWRKVLERTFASLADVNSPDYRAF
jgi:hypothetical protein